MKIKKRIFIIIVLGTIFIVVFQAYIWGISNDTKKSDTAIVLGCSIHGSTPSAFLKARTLRAAKLYKQGKVNYIIVSGGKGSGENISEAECMKEILKNNGVQEDRILLEEKATNTSQNIAYSKKIMKTHNLKSAIVVSNQFHLRRAQIICSKDKMKASYSGIFVKKYWQREIYGGLREMPAIIKDIVVN